MIRVLSIGDIVGKAGRKSLAKFLPQVRDEFSPDIVLVNGENAAGGFGITEKIYKYFIENLNVSCVTTGNHWADKREIVKFLPQTDRLIVPANMANVESTQDGFTILETDKGTPYAVINLSGRVFMNMDNQCPFDVADKIIEQIPSNVKIRIVDMHAEATSEKQGLAWHLASRVSLLYGTHSHVPTADERILDDHTGFLTDVGMSGSYDSVIGIRKEAAILRMRTGERKKFEPASKNLWMCYVITDIDEETGRCASIVRRIVKNDETGS